MTPIISVVFFGLDLTEQTQSEIIGYVFFSLLIILLVLTILYFVLFIKNIVSLKIDFKNNNTELLLKKMKRIKLGLIPFWIINFVCYINIMLFTAFGAFWELYKELGFYNFFIVLLRILSRPWLNGDRFLIIPIFIYSSYIFLCLTSIFSIVFLMNLRKNNLLSKKQYVTNALLQLFFITDIIGVVYMIKKWDKSNVA
jgi:hypothetical protein